MNKDEILTPILTAINDLREEVRENRKAIQKNSELIVENSKKIDENSRKIDGNSKKIDENRKKIDINSIAIASLEKRMKEHEEASGRDRKYILDILCKYEDVTDSQYQENKNRIDKLEKKKRNGMCIEIFKA